MLFWIVAAALTVAVLLLIVRPLVAAPRAASAPHEAADYNLEVYRDQLQEVDRDRARGLISEAQARAAKAEIGRRMLATAETAPRAPAAASRSARLLAVLLVLAVPVGAVAVYGSLGRPALPAQPLAERNLHQERGGPPQSVVAAVEKLRAQLAEQPNDPQGWYILSQAYAKMGRQDEAVEAARKAGSLAKDDPEVQGYLGEILASTNGGTITEESLRAFEAVVAADPKDARARFYLALGRTQAGDQKGALERLQALLADSPADAPWVPLVQDQIREVAVALNLDPAKVTPQPLPAEKPAAQSSAGAPTGAPEGMSPQDRDQMIRGMVASLAAKLEENPSDVDGWLKLARSYDVLGDREKALEAARRAREQAPERPDVLIAYASARLSALPKEAVADNRAMPQDVVADLRKALTVEPANRDALWLLGLDAAGTGRKDEAADLWGRLLAQFKPSDPEYNLLRARIDQLKAGG
ncbi:c-type cytochrome biogenesis protein CcmI [Azospirillum thermophilum]|uniref:C-type cytochrome biogenesis protein CcmI n=1 Tax=Azospirillum thermophilum TaxID=2202148 RepID=A0A2S2CTD7_9PROT|nr:c-type cytochrome biogenesis protein CcmI [Azospirillum thermophilum]AWK87774.1 c-type cytochrome biogenesis protein CcmI [Azospirillum thermophilum]